MNEKDTQITNKLIETIKDVFRSRKIDAGVEKTIVASQLYRFVIKARNGAMIDVKKFLRLEKDLGVYLENKNVKVVLDGGIFIDYPKETFTPIKTPKNTYTKYRMKVNIGKGIDSKRIVLNLRKEPHTLFSGETGSGKSVTLNSLISQLNKQGAEIYIVDTKLVSFTHFEDVKGILIGTDVRSGIIMTEKLLDELDNRKDRLAELGVDSIYKLTEEEIEEHGFIPQVLVIDELANTLADNEMGDMLEDYLNEIAIIGRAFGIHLVLATQRADSKIFSPLMKANMSNQFAFKVATASNSRVAIGVSGAELLRGQGDFLLRRGYELIRGQAYYDVFKKEDKS